MDGQWEYGVDSYQIPVPSGDCSIHFLVERHSVAESGKEKKKPCIEVAILVDGGEPAGPACTAIVETLETLESEYGGYPGRKDGHPFPGFTYWLVTHWDRDHYLGALEYISTVLKGFDKPVTAASVPIDDSTWGPKIPEEERSKIKGAAFGHIHGLQSSRGKDFFSNTAHGLGSEGQSFENYLSSLNLAPKPMFLCIAANGYSFNSKNRQKVESRNHTSATFVIVWPGSSQRPATDTFVYYAAGDGNPYLEKYFTEQRTFDLNASMKRCLVVKGTHHGAINSFNEGLFWQMRPENYIVSAGRKHGHPTAALLVKLAIFKAYNDLTVFTTRFPYFLLLESEDTTNVDLNMQHVVEAVDEASKARPWLSSTSAVESQKELWTDLEKLKALSPTESLKNDKAKFEDARTLFNRLWEYLSESGIPQNDTLETKPYRIDTHISRGSDDQIIAKVCARGNTDPPLF